MEFSPLTGFICDLWCLSPISLWSRLFYGALWTVTSVYPSYSGPQKNSFRSNQNNLNLTVWAYVKAALSAPKQQPEWFGIELFNCQSCFVCGKWLCLCVLGLSPKVKMVTVGMSARDMGSWRYLWLCVNSNVEKQIAQVCVVIFHYRSTAELPDPDAVLYWMLVK